VITPARVAELLILRADMPRSLHACVQEVYPILCAIANSQSAETQRRAGELHAELRFGRMEDIFRVGLHRWLTEFLDRTADLGNRIGADFLVPVEPPRPDESFGAGPYPRAIAPRNALMGWDE
jgi:uncharacterized alpha-E superfamily protein